MARIVMVSHSSRRAGAEQSLLAYAEALSDEGHSVLVTVPGPGPLSTALADRGVPTVHMFTPWWAGRRQRGLAGAARLAQSVVAVLPWLLFLRTARPDVVWTNSTVTASAAVAARLRGIPHVWFVREALLTNPSLRSALPPRWRAAAIHWCSTSVVCVSRFVLAQVTAHVTGPTQDTAQVTCAVRARASPVRVMHPPLTAFDPLPHTASGPQPGALDALYVGSFSPDKGVFDILDAVAAVVARGGNLRVRMVGGDDASDEAAVAREIRARGLESVISLLGWQPDVRTFYQTSDVLLMTSRNEAYGRVTVEALRSGVAVIGYDAGATTELLEEVGGMLIEPSPRALADALERAAADRSGIRRLGERGRALLEQRDEIRRVDDELRALLADVLPGGVPA